MLPPLVLARGTIQFLAVAVAALVFGPRTCDADRMTPLNIDPPKTPVDEQTDGGLTDTVSFAKAGTSMRLGAAGLPKTARIAVQDLRGR